MKFSILKRIEDLEKKIISPIKPCLFLREGEPEPENPKDYNIIHTRLVDHTNYLDPGSLRIPYCPI